MTDRQDTSRPIGRTAIQAGTPGALLVVATWVCKMFHVDLDPGAGVDMPADVSVALASLLTVGMAWLMNRPGS